MADPVILVFDSGLGGITVYRQLKKIVSQASFVYVADNGAFPYGDWQEQALLNHITAVMRELIETFQPDLVVIACNTASTLVLEALRAEHTIPFVGTVPAIKVAALQTDSHMFSVLATEGTVKRDYTHSLLHQFAAGCDVALVGAAGLANEAEKKMSGQSVDKTAIAKMIQPCFVEGQGRRTDHIVLACTHFPLLVEELRAVSPWSVTFIDPSPAIARQVSKLCLTLSHSKWGDEKSGYQRSKTNNLMLFTAPKEISQPLYHFLNEQGFNDVQFWAIDDEV